MVEMKTCTLCGEIKPKSEFGKHKQMKDGLSYWCKQCTRKRAKEYRRSPQGIYTRIKGRSVWYKNHDPKRYSPLEITREEFIVWYNKQPKICAYCDISEDDLLFLKEEFNNRVEQFVIDRKDNDRGYSLDNIVLACHRCNFIKTNLFSYEEMREIAQKFIKPKWSLRTREYLVVGNIER